MQPLLGRVPDTSRPTPTGTNHEPDDRTHSGLTLPRLASGLRAVQNAQSIEASAMAPEPSTYSAVSFTPLAGGIGTASGGSDRTARTVGSLTIDTVWSRVGLHAPPSSAAAQAGQSGCRD